MAGGRAESGAADSTARRAGTITASLAPQSKGPASTREPQEEGPKATPTTGERSLAERHGRIASGQVS
jgi:hypothetical protein